MRVLYQIGIRSYYLAASLLALWNSKARKWVRGRKGWYQKLTAAIGSDEALIWVHCASLGEFEQGRPVIEALRADYPEHRILLSFFSPSGYEKRKDYEQADHVMYLPLDTRRNARRLVAYLQPELAIFVKYEFWYHILHQLSLHAVPTYLISGNFRADQLFFKWYGKWYRRFLESFTQIFVQNEDSQELLNRFGIRQVSLSGDTRFDRVYGLAESEYHHPALKDFASGREVFIAGSTWEADEEFLAHAFRELPSHLGWIIAPHELSLSHIRKLQERFAPSVLFSQLEQAVPAGTRSIIIDSIGQLSYIYRYGQLAYIGGGFGKGIHNILEAATYGLPVLFGPRYQKFDEAVKLIREGGAFTFSSQEEGMEKLTFLWDDPRARMRASEIAKHFISAHKGATAKILEGLSANGSLADQQAEC